MSANGHPIKIEENLKNFLFKKPEEDIEVVLKILKYNVTADDKQEVDYIKLGIKTKVESTEGTDIHYNTIASVVDKDNNNLFFEFYKYIKIERTYEIRVPKDDITFLKRVKNPVKSFRLDYHFPDTNVKLVATCFGTLAFVNDGSIKILHESDHVSIESYSWLLPGNGVFVAMV